MRFCLYMSWPFFTILYISVASLLIYPCTHLLRNFAQNKRHREGQSGVSSSNVIFLSFTIFVGTSLLPKVPVSSLPLFYSTFIHSAIRSVAFLHTFVFGGRPCTTPPLFTPVTLFRQGFIKQGEGVSVCHSMQSRTSLLYAIGSSARSSLTSISLSSVSYTPSWSYQCLPIFVTK